MELKDRPQVGTPAIRALAAPGPSPPSIGTTVTIEWPTTTQLLAPMAALGSNALDAFYLCFLDSIAGASKLLPHSYAPYLLLAAALQSNC